MQIFGPFRVSTASPIGGAQRLPAQKPVDATTAPKSSAPIDKLDLSNHVNRLDATSQSSGSDIRVDRVADLRRQIANGNYDTPEKMDIALSRFLDDFA
jgi:negative regulator of flagellin synthesis FlgM